MGCLVCIENNNSSKTLTFRHFYDEFYPQIDRIKRTQILACEMVIIRKFNA